MSVNQYNLLLKIVYAFNQKAIMCHHRNNTNDFNTLLSCITHDEYNVQKFDIRDGDVVIDVGSHIGGFPLALYALGKRLGVYCYEPIPENYNILFKNLEDNDLQGFGYCWQKAVVGKKRDHLRIYYGDDSFNGMAHKFVGTHVENPPENWGRGYEDAETITLDQIFEENKIAKCKILKLDCEGTEYEILQFASEETLEKIDYIIGEYHGIEGGPKTNAREYLFGFVADHFVDVTAEITNKNQGEFVFKNKRLGVK